MVGRRDDEVGLRSDYREVVEGRDDEYGFKTG